MLQTPPHQINLDSSACRSASDTSPKQPKSRGVTNFSVQSLLDLKVSSPTDSGYCSSSPNPDDVTSRSRHASTDSRRSYFFEKQEAVEAASDISSKNSNLHSFWNAINSKFMPGDTILPAQQHSDATMADIHVQRSSSAADDEMSPLEALQRHTEAITKRSAEASVKLESLPTPPANNFYSSSATAAATSRNPFLNIFQTTQQYPSVYPSPVLPPLFCTVLMIVWKVVTGFVELR